MRLLNYDLLVVVTCQKHVQKKVYPSNIILCDRERYALRSPWCVRHLSGMHIYMVNFVLFHVFLAYDSALTLDGIIKKNNRYLKIWINEEQKIKSGLLAILLF